MLKMGGMKGLLLQNLFMAASLDILWGGSVAQIYAGVVV